MLVGYDFETHLIAPGRLAPKPVCLSLYRSAEGRGSLLDFEDSHLQLGFWLTSNLTLVGHNAAYDLVVAVAEWPDLIPAVFEAMNAGRLRCTKIRQELLDIAVGEHKFRIDGNGKATKAGRSLADLVALYFNQHLEKEDTWRLRYGELDGVPLEVWPQEAIEYPLKDAEWPVRVFDAQRKKAEEIRATTDMIDVWVSEPGEIPDEIWQSKSALWAQLMSVRGWRSDPVAVRALREEHDREKQETLEKLLPTGLMREDGTRNMALIEARVEFAFNSRNACPPYTPTGKPSTAADVLIESGDPELLILGRQMSDASTRGTWLPHLEQATTVPVNVGYNPLVETGRMSCREPNIMNPPRKGKIRQCIVPRPGYLLCSVDYDTAELRALAQICLWLVGWSDLAEALKTGEDPHLSLAADMEGITYAEALERKKNGDKDIAESRQLSKVANFGYPGGLGPDSFVAYAHAYDERFKKIVDRKKSTELRNAWFKKWREMKKYFELVNAAVGMSGSGAIQQFVSQRVRGNCSFTQAANGTFQGLVADGAKRAGWALTEQCYIGNGVLAGSYPLIFMHDEFILEIPEFPGKPEISALAALQQADVMREEMQKVIPDIPIKCNPTLMRRWYKSAEPVQVNGILVPSKPVEIDGKTKWVADVT